MSASINPVNLIKRFSKFSHIKIDGKDHVVANETLAESNGVWHTVEEVKEIKDEEKYIPLGNIQIPDWLTGIGVKS